MKRKLRLISYVGPSLGFLLFILALWVLHSELREENYHAILRRLGLLPTILVKALLLTGLNYFVLTGYDVLAFRYIGRHLAYAKLAFASFIGYGFSNALGFATIAGSTVRLRLYSSWGFGAFDIAKIVFFCTITLWLGLFAIGGVWVLLEPASFLSRGVVPVIAIRSMGVLLTCTAGGYLLLCDLRKKPFVVRKWQASLPTPTLAISQIVVSSLDWALAGSVLYVLLPAGSGIDYVQFFGVFLLAQVVGLVSQVPGGLGVFESVIVLFLSPPIPASKVASALLLYRAIYYLLPLAVASTMLAVHEAMDRWAQVEGFTRIAGRWIPEIVPWFLTLASFLGGVVLIASGATPGVPDRLAWLRIFVPLPLLEVSHFLSTLVGAGLLVVARGLQRRLDAAYHVTMALLLGGILFSLLKGIDYEEAGVLAIILALLIPSRRHFYRKASLLAGRFSPGWIAAVVLALAGSFWLTVFSYKHVAYSNDLLWQFTFIGDAPRSLRGIVGVVALVVVLGVHRLFQTAPPDLLRPGATELDRAHEIISFSRDTSANLALLGDKSLLFSESGKSFIMYAVEGRSWVAMRGPVGPEGEVADLLWSFRDMCDRDDGWPVFYEVGSEHLPLYLDLGLMPLKIGEEARVPLPGFTLDGGRRRGLRNIMHKIEREGSIFAIVPSSEVPLLLPELRMISDAWLKEKHSREKSFSLGFFSAPYLRRFPLAVVKSGGRITAFANIWSGAEKEELSVDLMRHLPDAPPGVMEYLFVRLIMWGKEEGYRWFNLGVVPLSGFEDHSLSPLWSKLGAQVYRHGEHFYNFQGLRHYKERFGPVWEPRYLVSPAGLHLPHILANVASLISGGLKGVVTR